MLRSLREERSSSSYIHTINFKRLYNSYPREQHSSALRFETIIVILVPKRGTYLCLTSPENANEAVE